MPCTLCATVNDGNANRQCAFPDGAAYTTVNRFCLTMRRLVTLARARGAAFSARDRAGSAAILPIPTDDDLAGYVVLTWAGDAPDTVGTGLVVQTDEEPEPLTRASAEAILAGLAT